MREYMASYYATALRTLLRRHRLIVDREFPHYEAPLRLGVEERARWHTMFGVAVDTARPPPFSYHSSVGTLMLMQVVADVGVNFRNLRHMRSEMELAPRAVEPGVEHRLRARLSDILVLRDDRVVLVVDSRLVDAEGQLLRSFRDYFVILALEPHHVDALRASRGFGRLPLPDLRDTVRKRSKLAGRAEVQRHPVEVPAEMGMRYGKVSGDLNFVHTTALAARLFGHERPFLQGLCTANHVLAVLAGTSAAPLLRFAIAFTQPVFTGQRIEVLAGWGSGTDAGEFEVIDGDAKVLAFGRFVR
jgi:MaoC like domain